MLDFLKFTYTDTNTVWGKMIITLSLPVLVMAYLVWITLEGLFYLIEKM